MKAKYIFLLLLLANINVLWASNTKVDGIWYDFDKSTKVATVTYRGKDYSAYAGEYKGNIIIPEFVKYRGTEYCVAGIAESAFFDCSELTSITIPGCIANIERQAFYNCTGLTSVTIGEGVKKIGKSAFNQCTSLRSIKIPNTITNIGDYAFYGCASLTSVTIPNSVTSIESSAFHYCIDLNAMCNTIFRGGNGLGKLETEIRLI